MEDRIMKKTLNFFFAIAALAGMFSCAKMEPAEQNSDIPEGYSKVYFTAGVADTKTTLNGTAIEWQRTDQVNIWYKDADGAVQKAAATIESCSGKTAYMSVILPDDAPKDDLIAELNGVIDNAGKLPFGTGNSRPRCKVNQEQTAVKGSYDPSSFSMTARWMKNGDEEPFFQFYNLVNLLKISVTNNTDRALKKIELSNDVSIASNNYWEIKADGTLSVNGSTTGSTSVTLLGDNIENGDYHFVVSAKNSVTGFFTLQNMKITFHFEGGAVRTFSNPNELSMSGFNLLVPIGSFVINSEDLDIEESIDPTYVPFGTKWTNSFISAWKNSYAANEYFEAPATEKPEGSPYNPIAFVKTATQKGAAVAELKDNYIPSVFCFEFYVAEAGTGILSFTARTGSSSQVIKTQQIRAEEVISEYKFTDSNEAGATYEINVEQGDLIKIFHNGGTDNGRLYLAGTSSVVTDRAITWTRKTE